MFQWNTRLSYPDDDAMEAEKKSITTHEAPSSLQNVRLWKKVNYIHEKFSL